MRTHLSLLLVAAIIALGAFLRVYHIRTLSTFRGDQAIELAGSAAILKGRLMLTGIKTSNSGMRNGALMYYVVAPFLLLFRYDPVAGGVAQTMLSLLTIPVVYAVGMRFGSGRIGMFAAFLTAASALLVRFSRQNMLAFSPLVFAALSLYLMVSLSTHFKRKTVLFLGTVIGVMLQIHYSSIAVAIAAVLLPWVLVPRKNIAAYFSVLAAGFLLGFTPMLLFEARHAFFNSRMFWELIRHGAAGQTQEGFSQLLFWRDAVALMVSGGNGLIAVIGMAALSVAGLLYRKTLTVLEKVCLIQLVSSVLFAVLFVRSAVPHYAVSAIPALFVLLSSFFDRAVPKKKYAIYAVALAVFFFQQIPSYGFGENHGWTMEEGWTLDGVKKAAAFIRDDVKDASWRQNYNVVMIVDGETKGFPLRYFLDLWDIPPLVPERYDTADVVYVVSTPEKNSGNTQLAELDAFGEHRIGKTWAIQNGYTLSRLEHTASLPQS